MIAVGMGDEGEFFGSPWIKPEIQLGEIGLPMRGFSLYE